MKIALAQTNSWLGDFARNREKILQSVTSALKAQCDLVVFPEAALFGYHPCDLLERDTIVQAQLKELKNLHKQLPKGIAVLLGAVGQNPGREGKPYTNAAVFLERGEKPKWFSKQLLPTYDVFDESRHIQPGCVKDNVLRWRGKKILVTICEDIWAWPRPGGTRSTSYSVNPLRTVKKPIDLVLNISASPFSQDKLKQRLHVVKSTAAHFKCPLVYVNMVGGQDELIFDGASFAIDAKGRILAQCRRFQEDLKTVTFVFKSDSAKSQGEKAPLSRESEEILRQAIVLGLAEFARKNGFNKIHLGLSGGIDSAVVAALAVDAVGAERVTGYALPGPFSSSESFDLASRLSRNLKIEMKTIAINSMYEAVLREIEKGVGPTEFSVMHENLQARLRATTLMSIANRENSLLLATSNKSELATGYSTLYGDMCGGLMPIGDLLKQDVYRLANWYNRESELIPQGLIDRPPTAELRPNQLDQDTLPPYEELDPAVHRLVEGCTAAKTQTEISVLRRLMQSEFKRWQAPPILKLTNHGFGRGRRLPIGHKAYF